MIFTAEDYASLHSLFTSGYKGYKPEVLEAPNGDGKVDVTKRYLHVALKYDPPEFARRLLARAHFEACRVAEAMRVPDAFYPRVADGTLRVLEYPAGAGSERHTDFDLFTVHCYRNDWGPFVRTRKLLASEQMILGTEINPGLHMGELGELVGLGAATPHEVDPSASVQHAIVYFAMPSHDAQIPGTIGREAGGATVGECLKERMSRSRVYK